MYPDQTFVDEQVDSVGSLCFSIQRETKQAEVANEYGGRLLLYRRLAKMNIE